MGVYTYTYTTTPPPILNLLSSSSSSSSSPKPNPNPPNTQITLHHHHHHHHLSKKNTPPLLSTNSNRRHLLLLFSLLPCSSSSVLAGGLDFVSPEEREASAVVMRRVDQAVDLLERGRELQAEGDFTQALLFFTQVIESYKDLALSDYARVGRALALYEVGSREDSIAEMENVSISLKGYPEIHAALAAALYVDKHAPLLAENQFTIATLLDPRYTDISYVTEMKHWPPSLISSLKNFITLS